LAENRFENLTKDELGVYKMLTLCNCKEISNNHSLVEICSGYVQIGHFDYGPIFSMILMK
jgi:hypothetical protein